MSSSSVFVPRTAFPTAGGRHQAVPVEGSYRSQWTEQPVVLTDPGCYPVTAECKVCRGTIRLARLLQMEWVHVVEDARSTPVSPGRGEPEAAEHPAASGGPGGTEGGTA